jgi:hypothetical protein
MAMLLASPISWSHHWVWAVPVALVLWERSRVAAVAWTAVFVARPILWPPWGDHRELDWSPLDHVVGNAYLIAAVVLAAWAAVALRPPTSLSRPDRGVAAGSGDGGSSGQHHRLARAVVAACQVGVQLVVAPGARDSVRQVRVVLLDGVPHLRASLLL